MRRAAADALEGKNFANMLVDPDEGVSIFLFDDATSLVTEPYDRESEQWLLYEPSGNVLTYRFDGKCQYQPGDKPDTDRWLAPGDLTG